MEFSNLTADTAHRFRVVAELIHAHGQQLPETPRLLDVGGYPGTFAREFTSLYPRWKALTVDLPEDNLPDYRPAAGTRLPFDDASFDAVVSIDTFEHIPELDRATCFAELCRVSKGLVVLAAPFYHPTIATIERLLDSTHEQVFQSPHPWLHEHVLFGLPHLDKAIASVPRTHAVVEVRRSFDLQAWLTWHALSLFRKLRGEVDNAWKGFDMAAAGSATPNCTELAYRYAIVAQRDARPMDFRGGIVPPPNAGSELVELARLYCRMIEVSAAETNRGGVAAAPTMVDQRLKEALVAAESQIADLRTQLSSNPETRASKILRMFRR